MRSIEVRLVRRLQKRLQVIRDEQKAIEQSERRIRRASKTAADIAHRLRLAAEEREGADNES